MTTRIPVLKTYKLFIKGAFPRTESGRSTLVKGPDGRPIANICRASRKDFREAVVAARGAQDAWAKRTAYNRSQILYRIAEMLETRQAQFIEELASQGVPASAGQSEVQHSIDRLVHYAGWADKYTQVFSSVNPVASSHFNFSIPEPTGVVAILLPDAPSLLGLVTHLTPAIVGGNTVIALASRAEPLTAITFAEVLATSDVPGGVVNLLTGDLAELAEHFASHMDVNAIVYAAEDRSQLTKVQQLAAANVKRVIVPKIADYADDLAQSPYAILDLQEIKTTWHPIETGGGSGGGY